MRLRDVVLLVLLAGTVVVPVRLLAEDDAAVAVAPAPPFNPSRVKALSWQPRIFVYKGFLSDDECDHLVTLAKKETMVAHNQSEYFFSKSRNQSEYSQGRTSSGVFLKKRQDLVVSRIEERIAAWTFLPEENAEKMQVQRYEQGQKYDQHMDQGLQYWLNPRAGESPRYATVIMYLSTVDKGGETVFPKAMVPTDSISMFSQGRQFQFKDDTLLKKKRKKKIKDDTFSECAQKGLAVKPVKGDAVLFFSLHADGAPDPLSLHKSCPVIQGEKWSAPKWIHTRSYEYSQVVVPNDAPTLPKELQSL